MNLPNVLRAGLSAVLCSTLAVQAMPSTSRVPAAKPLSRDARAQLMLQRFTFGPTQSDLQSIHSMGIDAWFRQQLSPETIPDSAFESRMDVYPALRMTQADRLQRYPEPATIRVLAKSGKLPSDPELRAIVSDQVEFYQMVQQNKAAKAQAPAGMLAASSMMNGSAEKPVALTAAQAQAQATVANLEQTTEPMPKPQVEAILALPANDRYAHLLSMQPVDLIALRKGARGPLEAKLVDGMSPMQKETLLALSGTNRMINAETQGARLLRDVYSQRQLQAVMTDFWLNHFNVFSGKSGQEPSLLPEYEQTVRDHALGHFEDLLVATAQSPAMLMYLDNATSTGMDSPASQRERRNPKNKANSGLNENYARELMELHTLGVNGGYTQKDVTEVAKVFTGWTLQRPYDGGDYTFNANRHQPGDKTVLGKTIKQNGEEEGREVLHMLATSPATAHFISTEIAQRFVSDAPPKALVDRMAQTFLKSNGDIKAVLLTMVHSPEFFSTTAVNAKLKTPLEYVTSAVRASSAEISNPLPLVQSLQQLGMPLYGCMPPTGYKWDEATWLSSSALINRMNFSLALATNRIGGVTVDWTPVLAANAVPTMKPVAMTENSADSATMNKEAMLETKLFEVPVSSQTRNAVIHQGNDGVAAQASQQFAQTNNGRTLTQAEKAAQQQDQLDAMMMARRAGQPANVTGGMKGQAVVQRGLGATPAKPGPPPVDKQAAAMAGLLLGSPEFQRR